MKKLVGLLVALLALLGCEGYESTPMTPVEKEAAQDQVTDFMPRVRNAFPHVDQTVMVMDITDEWVGSEEGLRYLNLCKEGNLTGYSPTDLPIQEVWLMDLVGHYQQKVQYNFWSFAIWQWIKDAFGEGGPQNEEGMKALWVMGGGYPWSNSVLEERKTRYALMDFRREVRSGFQAVWDTSTGFSLGGSRLVWHKDGGMVLSVPAVVENLKGWRERGELPVMLQNTEVSLVYERDQTNPLSATPNIYWAKGSRYEFIEALLRMSIDIQPTLLPKSALGERVDWWEEIERQNPSVLPGDMVFDLMGNRIR